MTVSAINRTSSGRYTIVLEDGREIKSTLNAVSDLMLYTGKELEEQELNELISVSERSVMLQKAIDCVSRRQMSVKELRDKLIEKGAGDAVADYCIDRLISLKLLNDEAYAASVVRHYSSAGYGTARIRSELKHRGIERDLWDTAFDSMETDDFSSQIDSIIKKKLHNPKDSDAVKKVSAYLFRRGYSWDEIRSSLSRFEIETEQEE